MAHMVTAYIGMSTELAEARLELQRETQRADELQRELEEARRPQSPAAIIVMAYNGPYNYGP